MKLNLKARDWHNWVSVVLVVPMLLVGMTSLFIAHKQALKLNEIDLSGAVGWLPGYGRMAAPGMEIRASLALPDGNQWVGTQAGLYRIVDGQARVVEELGGTQVRDIVAAPWGIVAATQNGVWVLMQEGWRNAHKSDAWNASLNPDGSVAVAIKDQGLLVSHDGTKWQSAGEVRQTLAQLPAKMTVAERITLGKLVTDLHTGKAFFGKANVWIWIDILGIILTFLGGTGLWMWWKSQTKRRDAAHARLTQEALHG